MGNAQISDPSGPRAPGDWGILGTCTSAHRILLPCIPVPPDVFHDPSMWATTAKVPCAMVVKRWISWAWFAGDSDL